MRARTITHSAHTAISDFSGNPAAVVVPNAGATANNATLDAYISGYCFRICTTQI